jgi:hypothetical protein
MRSRRVDSGSLLVAWLSALHLGCATGPPAAPYRPDGELVGGGVTFDATSVRGSGVNMSRRQDGTWAGNMNGRFSQVTVGRSELVISGPVATRVHWQSSPAGPLLLVRDVEPYLLRVCEDADDDCGIGTGRPPRREEEQVANYCPDLGCKHVLHWSRLTHGGLVPLPSLIIALYAGGLLGRSP